MNDGTGLERRKAARYDARLNLNVHLEIPGEGEGFSDLETINVSSSGLYFRSETYVEPMTKLALSFDVPVSVENHEDRKPVNCEGIVVRIVPELPEDAVDGFEVAVFFTTIDADSLHNLEAYLSFVFTE